MSQGVPLYHYYILIKRIPNIFKLAKKRGERRLLGVRDWGNGKM
jgi:hypothetical protein